MQLRLKARIFKAIYLQIEGVVKAVIAVMADLQGNLLAIQGVSLAV